MSNKATQILAEYVAQAEYGHLPSGVVERVKCLLLDDIGCALGGYPTEGGKILVDFAHELAGGKEATLVGDGGKASCMVAAGVNAQIANILDFDETWKIGHPASSIVFTAIGVGERLGAKGSEVINAIVTAYEVSTRIGQAVWHGRGLTSKVRAQSWHVYGPAIAAARLLGLDREAVGQVIGIAGGIAPTQNVHRLIDRPSHMIKVGNLWWCLCGVTAAFLASKGFMGIKDWLDGDRGYWSMVSDSCDWESLTQGLGTEYHIVTDMHLKPWSTCRHMHGGIDLAVAIVRGENLAPEDIEEIVFRSYALVCSPPYDEPKPAVMWDAFWSVPWGIALAVLGYPPGPEWYTRERFQDAALLSLARKIRVEPLPEATKAYQERGINGVITELEVKARGQTFKRRVEGMKGDPHNPLSYAEVTEKFQRLAAGVISPRKRQLLVRTVAGLESLEDIRRLTRLLYQ